MKKYLITTLASLVAFVALHAQDFKLAKTTGKLVINIPAVVVEGYSGSEIVFSSSRDRDDDDDGRAKGLRPINGSGFEDNTGLGISVVDKGTTIEVNAVSQRERSVTIKIPKGVSVSYTYNRVQHGDVVFKNVESEIEVSVLYNKVKLDNVTGPLSIKTIHGSIDAKLGDNLKGPISIVSVHGHVDVAMPTTTKANLKLSTNYGEIFAASDFKIEMDKANTEMVSYSNKVRGKLNGGGTDITLSSDHNKIYLRKN